MGQYRLLLLSLLLCSFHSIPCYSSHDDASLYSIRAYPTYNGALDGDESSMDQKPYGFITQTTDEVDISASRVVNVASYGAKGDGSDDTEVV